MISPKSFLRNSDSSEKVLISSGFSGTREQIEKMNNGGSGGGCPNKVTQKDYDAYMKWQYPEKGVVRTGGTNGCVQIVPEGEENSHLMGTVTAKNQPLSEEHKAQWEAIGNSSLEKQYPASEGWTIAETPTGYIVSKPNTP